MPVRRPRKHVVHLEVTAFINVIVVLVPFLLSTAVFSHLAVLDLSLPAKSSGPEQIDADNLLKLEIVMRPDALEVGDRIGGLIQRIPSTPQGYDLATLSTLMQTIKAKHPATRSASVLAQPDTAYDNLVQVMDAVRQARPPGATGKTPDIELFPDISIGDAPTSARKN
ncbi:ExbD/TolR family protein [Roseateles sp. BYS96W]|uniref:ExbD/TolR family protein n=1 Tax=Pelomonas nitida TaxID=3299027 RepID=A0ABW7GBZ6_9BURK